MKADVEATTPAGGRAAVSAHMQALFAIEDTLTELRAATGPLTMVFNDMVQEGTDSSPQAQTVFYVERTINRLVDRIYEILGDGESS